jgi:hypothetical protein
MSRLKLIAKLYLGCHLALLLGCGKSEPPAAAPATRAPSITADPNPMPATLDSKTTTISWDTGDGSLGVVYVSVEGDPERRFSGSQAAGSLDAPWIGKGVYEFRLYSGTVENKGKLLASVQVTRADQ